MTPSEVPLWRDGTATLSHTVYVRGTWAALALLVGVGSVSLAVFSGIEVTWAHIALPALLTLAGAAFAIWQIGLIAVAARRSVRGLPFAATAAGDTALNDLTVTLSADGRTLYVSGSYGTGSADAVRRALERNKGIRTVVLAGPGGRASVGFELYRLFQERKLATRVEGGCASACTIAFLGGVERSISPGGRLGFHRASFPGMGDEAMHESNRDLRRFLIYGAKVTPEFASRVFETAPDSIWVPTPQELLAGRVINRVDR
jgi:hypothetical protein